MIRPAFTHWFDVVDLPFVSNTQSTQLARFVAFRPIGDLLWSAMEIPVLLFVIAFAAGFGIVFSPPRVCVTLVKFGAFLNTQIVFDGNSWSLGAVFHRVTPPLCEILPNCSTI